ncbi:hypothetical protein AaE_005939 [Aphanomyces astaci]|uniref:Uncharacterized protein n=1 Tax=Aphanomyces astaci TaxID=112090 RepID=A0A6A5A6K2_APHAT|nr:hypothetical protein AaE_005939 [Aphanomyces astaci]
MALSSTRYLLCCRGLFTLVAEFQHGVLEDMVPLTSLASTTTSCILDLWIAEHGDARVPLLLVYLPHLTSRVILHAIATNKPDLLKTLELDAFDHDDLVEVAAVSGNLPAIVALHAMSYYSATHRAMLAASIHGHLNVLVYMHVERMQTCTRAIVNAAASRGHVHIVQWCHEHGGQTWAAEAFAVAAAAGHLAVLSYMHRVKPRCGSATVAMRAAAIHGHLHIVQFLHVNRPGCGISWSDAMDQIQANTLGYLTLHNLVYDMCCACGFHKPRNHECRAIK